MKIYGRGFRVTKQGLKSGRGIVRVHVPKNLKEAEKEVNSNIDNLRRELGKLSINADNSAKKSKYISF